MFEKSFCLHKYYIAQQKVCDSQKRENLVAVQVILFTVATPLGP